MRYLNLKKIFKKSYLSLIIVFIFISFLIFTRANLDKTHIFIASDAQIKFFQTIQTKNKGFLNIQCLYPGSEKDPSYKFYPIRYPWTIIDTNRKTCVFEYPPFFPMLGSIVLSLLGSELSMYYPIAFYIFAGILFLIVLNKYSINNWLPSMFLILTFLSFPLLTSMDYSESPLYHFFIMIGLFFYFRIKLNSSWRGFYFGFFLGIAIFFRMEILIPATLLCFFLMIENDSILNRVKKSFIFGVGFSIPVSVFLFYNYIESGHILGYRYISSLLENRIVDPNIVFKLTLLKAYLWGDSIMIGIFKFYPFLLLVIPIIIGGLFKKMIKADEAVIFLTGTISLFAIPLSVNFYGGVGYFGLRYLETPFFFIMLSFVLFLNRNFNHLNNLKKFSLIILIIFCSYINYKNTKEGLKVLRSGSKDYQKYQTEIQKNSKSIIIHTSLYTSIYIGESLMNFPNYHINSASEINKFLKMFPKSQELVILFPPQNMYISSDIPENLISNYDSKVKLSDLNVSIKSINEISSVKIVHSISN